MCLKTSHRNMDFTCLTYQWAAAFLPKRLASVERRDLTRRLSDIEVLPIPTTRKNLMMPVLDEMLQLSASDWCS